MGQPSGRNILLGVTGSIAACKSLELAGQLVRAGHDVNVVQTPASRHFVGEAEFAAVSGNKVLWDQFEGSASQSPYSHIELAASDLLVIAPATANTIGKMAAGIADNLLLTTYLASQCPVIICPAMNHYMWNHPAVQDNIRLLEERGITIVNPETGSLACGDEGDGRLAEPVTIFSRIQEVLGGKTPVDLEGVRVLVTAGGTREPLDSVRFIANRSSGRMGFAVAAAARSRGARVTVIAANCNLSRTPGISYIDVVTAGEMEKALENEVEGCDVLFMAAAVSDYKVSGMQTTGKIER
ncbi:MAG: bifunctional phosphopantothenoylcysteine decarboxylase/phosphopantothenate--cysteine ligase CoaBC, partial [Actinomycetota bacterium]